MMSIRIFFCLVSIVNEKWIRKNCMRNADEEQRRRSFGDCISCLHCLPLYWRHYFPKILIHCNKCLLLIFRVFIISFLFFIVVVRLWICDKHTQYPNLNVRFPNFEKKNAHTKRRSIRSAYFNAFFFTQIHYFAFFEYTNIIFGIWAWLLSESIFVPIE